MPRWSRDLQGREPRRATTRAIPGSSRSCSAEDCAALGEKYLADTRVYRSGKPRFIDKMPNNFRHIGLIHLMLPNARIIDARREPMACCFSNFKQLFASGQEFTYSIEDIARYYRIYVRAHAALGYGAARQGTAGSSTRTWSTISRATCGGYSISAASTSSPRVSNSHKTERSVRTASSEQVRQPIYQRGSRPVASLRALVGFAQERVGTSGIGERKLSFPASARSERRFHGMVCNKGDGSMNFNPKLSYAIAAILGGTGAGVAQAATTSDTETSTDTIQEIVVTAQRRTENMQDVPISIQALTGETLTQLNVQTFDDYIKYLPNVTTASNGPGQNEVFMRGLSPARRPARAAARPAYGRTSRSTSTISRRSFPNRNLDIYAADLNRIEVLEGPQGTLFGAGAEAGVIRYITNEPKLDVTEGSVKAGYGVTAHGDPNSDSTAVLNLPLIPDTLAVRGVIYDDHRGGYIDNVPGTFTRKNTDLGFADYGYGDYPTGCGHARRTPNRPSWACRRSQSPAGRSWRCPWPRWRGGPCPTGLPEHECPFRPVWAQKGSGPG